MDLLQKFQELFNLISSLQAQLADAQAALVAEKQASYEQGFAAGQAASGGDKIYSQAEVDAMLLPLNEQIAALQAQVAGVPDQIAAAVAQAKAELKEQIKGLLAAQQASESASEAQLPLDIDAL